LSSILNIFLVPDGTLNICLTEFVHILFVVFLPALF
jgi:hypothetical protein